MARRRFLQVATSGAIAFAGHPANGKTRLPTRLDAIGPYVEAAMAKWRVPGLALAIVQEGQLILARGFGVREHNAEATVGAETLFPLASCTKSFTAAAIAKLVDQGKLGWDDPIAKYLPALQLDTPDLTARVTIRQALMHRTGLPNANMLWRRGDLNSDEIVARLRWLPPVAAPGERFFYNNNLYLVAGKVIEKVAGRKWSDFMRTEFFEPLEMKSTIADSTGLRGLQNIASPHAIDDGTLRVIPRHCPDAIAPAGAIHSNVLNIARWLKLHLEGGRSNGGQVLSAARIDELHTPPPKEDKASSPDVPRAPIQRYGLGWFFNEHAGRQLVEHSGTQTGFVSWIAMLPEERLGLVILANCHRTGLNYALRSWILDAVLGRPERDWSEEVRTDYAKGWQRQLREAKADFEAKRPKPSHPPRPLKAYAADYESRLYGDLHITAANDRMSLRFGSRFAGELLHWENDTFRVTFPNPRLDDWLITFTTKDQQVIGLRAKESPWAPAWYEDADDLGDFRRK